MFFRQLFDSNSSTYTYLLADDTTREAVVIDPVFEQFDRDKQLITELGLRVLFVLDTHVHADHVTAAFLFRRTMGAKSVLSERAGSAAADWLVKEGDVISFGSHKLHVRETPGHTGGCLSFVLDEGRCVFTGDTLLIRGCGRTDFQQGDVVALYRSVHDKIFSLPDTALVYPAHDYKGQTVSSVGEEKKYNPRLALRRSLEDYKLIMAGLNLPYPKQMERALPRNLQGGEPDKNVADLLAREDFSWAPIQVTPAGVPEVSPEWVAENLMALHIIDVRQTDEYRGELGHIPGAELVPLGVVATASAGIDQKTPLVFVCRSGGRSAKAALELAGAGFTRVASMAGGMRSWNAKHLPIDFGAPPHVAVTRQG